MKLDFDIKAAERFIKKLTHPNAAHDLNAFLEKMPVNAGQTMLVIAGVAWACAGASGLFAYTQLQELTQVRAELQEAKSLQPVVPKLVDKPVNPQEVQDFVEDIKDIYKGIEIKASGAGVVIEAKNTIDFAQFREAVGHIQNGGQGWRVSVDRLCVGRECDRNPLAASFKINKVDITEPGA